MLTISVLKYVMKERFKAFTNDGFMFSINGQSPYDQMPIIIMDHLIKTIFPMIFSKITFCALAKVILSPKIISLKRSEVI